jgi:alkanesulfonate monooxygenase SsuD/methylene tetrahydromethanopterin reductase-like flavin-dependent oxidoreductase (luciferase family)
MKTEQNLKTAIEQKRNEIAEAILSGLPQTVIDALEAELKTLEQALDDLQANPEDWRP